MKHIRVSVFALGSTGGGQWEEAVLVSNKTAKATFNEALDYIKKLGYASEVTLTFCKKNGENFQ